MNPFFPSSKLNKKKRVVASESVETDRPTQTVNSLDLFKTSPKDLKDTSWGATKDAANKAWQQFLGLESYSSGPPTYQEGVEYSPSEIAQMQNAQAEQQAQQEAEPQIQTTQEHSRYVQEIMGEAHQVRESRESEQRIESLIVELRKLASSVQAVEKAVVLQAIGPAGAAQMKGKYYENFFEWMLLVVQDARRKVEDSGAWLQTMTGKSKGKQAIGKMKHSMNQLLSGERTAQNQTG